MNNDPKKFDDQLTPDEQARTIKLIEEAGEVIQAATKTLRFGAHNWNPADKTKEYNVDALEREIGDFIKAAENIFSGIGSKHHD